MARSVAYLGPPGTFTEQAVRRHAPEAVLQSFSSIQGVALAVASGIADEGVVPIENSLQGSVNDTLDILISQSVLFISRELVMPIEHCLLVLWPTPLSRKLRSSTPIPKLLDSVGSSLNAASPRPNEWLPLAPPPPLPT